MIILRFFNNHLAFNFILAFVKAALETIRFAITAVSIVFFA